MPWREFQSTSSARRTTDHIPGIAGIGAISIHVLREEDDQLGFALKEHQGPISIHVLREEDDVPCVDGL